MVLGRNKPAQPPAGAAAAAPCAELRAAYHDCFNRWYAEKFARGQFDKEECTAEWEKYRACLLEHLQDKHLRQILLDSESSPFYVNLETDPPPKDDGAATK